MTKEKSMADQDRISRLYGNSLPVRVIPASRPAAEGSAVKQGEHKSFRDLVIDDSHPAWIEGLHIPDVHNQTLLHTHEGGGTQHVVVSSANLDALNAHLDSVKIWTQATPSKQATGPQPIDVQQVVDDAVQAVTGSSVSAHLGRPRFEKHVHYHHLLGADAAAHVRQHAVDVLDGKLLELMHAKMIDEDDHNAIDAGWVIDHFLKSKAEGPTKALGLEDHDGHAAWLQERPGAVLTRLGPLPEGHDLAFSIQDIGTIELAQQKSYLWEISELSEFQEYVTVVKGEVKLKMFFDVTMLQLQETIPFWDAENKKKENLYKSPTINIKQGQTCRLFLTGLQKSSVTLTGSINEAVKQTPYPYPA